MAVFVTSSTGDTETNDDLLTAGQKWSEYYDNFSLQTENYTPGLHVQRSAGQQSLMKILSLRERQVLKQLKKILAQL